LGKASLQAVALGEHHRVRWGAGVTSDGGRHVRSGTLVAPTLETRSISGS
jgi:hypothetical protein